MLVAFVTTNDQVDDGDEVDYLRAFPSPSISFDSFLSTFLACSCLSDRIGLKGSGWTIFTTGVLYDGAVRRRKPRELSCYSACTALDLEVLSACPEVIEQVNNLVSPA